MKQLTFPALLLAVMMGCAVQAQDESAQEFRLSVFGMYCNQCAYGYERALERLPGVTQVSVDLRAGMAVVVTGADVWPEAELLVRATIDQGLSLRAFEATLVGHLEHKDIGWVLVAGGREVSLALEGAGLDLAQHVNRTVALAGAFAGIAGIEETSGQPRFVPIAVRDVDPT